MDETAAETPSVFMNERRETPSSPWRDPLTAPWSGFFP
jgi:hypothetical protein